MTGTITLHFGSRVTADTKWWLRKVTLKPSLLCGIAACDSNKRDA